VDASAHALDDSQSLRLSGFSTMWRAFTAIEL